MSPARRALLVAVLGGVGFATIAPPTDAFFMLWAGLGGLFVATADAPRARTAALRTCVWFTVATLVGMRWIPGVVDRFTPLGMAGGLAALFLMAVGQSVPWAAAIGLFHFLSRRIGAGAVLPFAAAVTLGSSITIVIGWSPAALISPWAALVQLADVIGERGVTFLFATSAALLFTPLRGVVEGPLLPPRLAWRAPALGAALLALIGVHGALRLREVRAAHAALPAIEVGVVQAAVPARLRWEPGAKDEILLRLRRLTAESEARGATLTVWPEAAYPYVLLHAPHRMPRGRRGIVGPLPRSEAGVRGPVLFGALTETPNNSGRYNAATIVDPDGRTQTSQAKMALLWFGETVPFGQYLPWLQRQFFRAGGLVPGDEVVLLTAGPARIGVLNCFEDTLAGVGRRVAAADPNLLVNITNDAWFGPTAEPELHLRLSALRSVELRRDLVRAVNLGVPAWVDASGTVRARGNDREPSVLRVAPALNDGPATFYARFGDAPLIGVIVALFGVAWWRKKRSTEPPRQPADR